MCFQWMDHLDFAIRREIIYLTKHRPFIELLSISHPVWRPTLHQLRNTLFVPYFRRYSLPSRQSYKLRPVKGDLAELTDRNSRFKRKKHVQRGCEFPEWCLVEFSKHCRISIKSCIATTDVQINSGESKTFWNIQIGMITTHVKIDWGVSSTYMHILTWTLKGQILSKAHDIRRIHIVELVRGIAWILIDWIYAIQKRPY